MNFNFDFKFQRHVQKIKKLNFVSKKFYFEKTPLKQARKNSIVDYSAKWSAREIDT